MVKEILNFWQSCSLQWLVRKMKAIHDNREPRVCGKASDIWVTSRTGMPRDGFSFEFWSMARIYDRPKKYRLVIPYTVLSIIPYSP